MAPRTIVTEEQRVRAGQMFETGESVNKVAEELFNGNWAAAKKLHAEFYPGKRKKGQRKAQPQEAAEARGQDADVADEPEAWDIALQVPSEQLDKILLRFSSQEKADAISAVLQARLAEA